MLLSSNPIIRCYLNMLVVISCTNGELHAQNLVWSGVGNLTGGAHYAILPPEIGF